MNKTMMMRKAQGLCVKCGFAPARSGKTQCSRCAQITAMDARKRREKMTADEKENEKAYLREYQKSHKPTKDKKAEYNRRYRDNNPTCMMINRERWVTLNGERVRLPDLAKRLGISYGVLYNRLYVERISLTEAILRG